MYLHFLKKHSLIFIDLKNQERKQHIQLDNSENALYRKF